MNLFGFGGEKSIILLGSFYFYKYFLLCIFLYYIINFVVYCKLYCIFSWKFEFVNNLGYLLSKDIISI